MGKYKFKMQHYGYDTRFLHPEQKQMYFKKGKIHSEKAMKQRAKKWMENWGCIIPFSNRVFENICIDSSEITDYCYSVPPESCKGFAFEEVHECMTVYGMTTEQIENIEMEETFTTDEEEEDDEERTSSPVPLYLEYCAEEKKLELCPSENHEPDEKDPEAERTRPLSRISLALPPYNGAGVDGSDSSDCETKRPVSRMSQSGYMSYFETDYEDENDKDNNDKFVSKTPKSSRGVYGKIQGVNVGTVWKNRRQFSRRSVHRPQNAIIHGGPKGAYSMVLSATYSVNDRGKEFDFYGEGGRDSKTKKHVRDQKMERGNLSLRENIQSGNPVRVIRGFQLQNMYAPEYGYRYDGLYKVIQNTMDRKIDGFKVFMFTFVRCGNQPPPPWHTSNLDLPLPSPNSVDHHLSPSPWHTSNQDLPLSSPGTVGHHLSDSEDDTTPENKWHKKPNRKKRKRSTVPEIRSSSPLSCTSDDLPPELQLPENNECPFVYPVPPCLSPSLLIRNAVIDIRKRPVLLLEKLNDSIVAEALVKPVNVKDAQLTNSGQKNLGRKKSKSEDETRLKKKRKYVYNRNKASAVNANISKKKIKSVVSAAKQISNKLLKLPQNSKCATKEAISNQSVKKRGRPKMTLTSKDNFINSAVAAKKRGHLKVTTINNTNVRKYVGKVGVKKDFPHNKQVKRKRGKPKGATNKVKSTNSKKYYVASGQKNAVTSKTKEKKNKKVILKKGKHVQGKKFELPHSYPGKKRGRKRKIE